MKSIRHSLVVLLLFFAFAFASSEDTVTAVYPQAFCVKPAFETKFKVFSSPTNRRPIGYGPTEDAAWDDAAAHLSSSIY